MNMTGEQRYAQRLEAQRIFDDKTAATLVTEAAELESQRLALEGQLAETSKGELTEAAKLQAAAAKKADAASKQAAQKAAKAMQQAEAASKQLERKAAQAR